MNYSANGIVSVGAPGSDARKQNNLDGFMEIYTEELTRAVKNNPSAYNWPVENVPVVAAKMRAAFVRGGYNKDSDAIKAACKRLGLKRTYAELNAFFKGE